MRSDNPARAVARRRCRLIGWLCFGTTLLWLLAGFAYSSSAQSVATDGKRIALVIGIGKYRYAPSLQNPVNDGHRIAEALRRLNFQVDEAYDSGLSHADANPARLWQWRAGRRCGAYLLCGPWRAG